MCARAGGSTSAQRVAAEVWVTWDDDRTPLTQSGCACSFWPFDPHVAVFVSVVRTGVRPSCGVGSFVVVVQVVDRVFWATDELVCGRARSCNQSVLALEYGVLCFVSQLLCFVSQLCAAGSMLHA